MDEPVPEPTVEAGQIMMTAESEPKTSETKSNTDSNPTSNNQPIQTTLVLQKKHSQTIEQPFVAQQANMLSRQEVVVEEETKDP